MQDERDSAQQQLDRAIALEKTRAECEQLTADLAALVAEATKLLSDSDAVPTMFATTADAFVLPLEHAKQVLNNAPAEDAQFIHLNALVSEAKDAHSALLHRADIWRQFVAERDSATDQLEVMRAPLDEIELRRRRSFDEVLQDLEALKVCFLLFWHLEFIGIVLIASYNVLQCTIGYFHRLSVYVRVFFLFLMFFASYAILQVFDFCADLVWLPKLVWLMDFLVSVNLSCFKRGLIESAHLL